VNIPANPGYQKNGRHIAADPRVCLVISPLSVGTSPVHARWRLRRPGVIAEAAQSIGTFGPVPKELVVPLRPGYCSLPEFLSPSP
jgi:hypothetical protein